MLDLPRDRAREGEEVILDGQELERLIDKYVNGKKAERNRGILKAYYLDGMTYEEVAEDFKMSAVHIGRIVHKYGDPLLLMLQKG